MKAHLPHTNLTLAEAAICLKNDEIPITEKIGIVECIPFMCDGELDRNSLQDALNYGVKSILHVMITTKSATEFTCGLLCLEKIIQTSLTLTAYDPNILQLLELKEIDDEEKNMWLNQLEDSRLIAKAIMACWHTLEAENEFSLTDIFGMDAINRLALAIHRTGFNFEEAFGFGEGCAPWESRLEIARKNQEEAAQKRRRFNALFPPINPWNIGQNEH